MLYVYEGHQYNTDIYLKRLSVVFSLLISKCNTTNFKKPKHLKRDFHLLYVEFCEF